MKFQHPVSAMAARHSQNDDISKLSLKNKHFKHNKLKTGSKDLSREFGQAVQSFGGSGTRLWLSI